MNGFDSGRWNAVIFSRILSGIIKNLGIQCVGAQGHVRLSHLSVTSSSG